MDRRKFLQIIPAGIAAAVIAPKLLIPKEPVKITPMQVYKPKDYSFVVAKSRRIGFSWVQHAEWQFAKDWERQQAMLALQYGRMDMCEFLNYMSK